MVDSCSTAQCYVVSIGLKVHAAASSSSRSDQLPDMEKAGTAKANGEDAHERSTTPSPHASIYSMRSGLG